MEQININQLNTEIITLKSQMNEIMKFLHEDLEFARRTEEAWQEIDEGKFKEYPAEKFFEIILKD